MSVRRAQWVSARPLRLGVEERGVGRQGGQCASPRAMCIGRPTPRPPAGQGYGRSGGRSRRARGGRANRLACVMWRIPAGRRSGRCGRRWCHRTAPRRLGHRQSPVACAQRQSGNSGGTSRCHRALCETMEPRDDPTSSGPIWCSDDSSSRDRDARLQSPAGNIAYHSPASWCTSDVINMQSALDEAKVQRVIENRGHHGHGDKNQWGLSELLLSVPL